MLMGQFITSHSLFWTNLEYRSRPQSTIWGPLTWKCLMPIRQFRTIFLLSAECKILFSVLAKRMSMYMIENGCVNTSIQNSGIPGFAGCLEHTGVLSHTRGITWSLYVLPEVLPHTRSPQGYDQKLPGWNQALFKNKGLYHKVASPRESCCHRMYNLPHPVHHGHEPHH